MSQNIFKNFENFWNKNDIKQKAEDYHNYFENTDKEGDFSWINEKDKSSLKKGDIPKSMKWGIPNHILGDIDKAKFIIGLLNPGTNMKKEESESCNTVGDYICEEKKHEMCNKIEDEEMYKDHKLLIRTEVKPEEKKYKIPFPFSSKEVYEKDTNKEIDMYNYYYNHILDKENVLSHELKSLYKLYNNNIDVFEDLKNHKEGKKENQIKHPLKNLAYYFFTYYKGCFGGKSQIKKAIYHYERIFEKINAAKRKTDKKKIDKEFEESLFKMPITNVELIPYRTEKAPEQRFLESSKISANAIIEKVMQDKDTIVILRSYDRKKEEDKENKYNWKKLFKNICEERNIDFKKHIEPSIYLFKNQNGSISKNNVKEANPYNSIKPVEQVVRELNESIKLSDLEKDLDTNY
ncbi:hypothetical protein [Staphylococcus epidermidis]|uniref:hypothetical protein n=1 Tax=Staphylococcus epidermidis TaxID=1282 RepID=UPI0011A9E570|nr:hypothetical protein [Staphylococcus epidermidis]